MRDVGVLFPAEFGVAFVDGLPCHCRSGQQGQREGEQREDVARDLDEIAFQLAPVPLVEHELGEGRAGLRNFNVLHVCGCFLAHDGRSWALPLLWSKESFRRG